MSQGLTVLAADKFTGEVQILVPDWPLPPSVCSVITTSSPGVNEADIGGVTIRPASECSKDRSAGGNLGLPSSISYGSDPYQRAVAERSVLAEQLKLTVPVQWLQQEHGTQVIEAAANGVIQKADASFTRLPGLACAVLTADCLPVLICNRDGSQVAAVHAGWRGLAAGILNSTIEAFGDSPGNLMGYLGPAICGRHFEVGPEVRQAFLTGCMGELDEAAVAEVRACFVPSGLRPGHCFADLYQLARIQLSALGVKGIYGGEYCTYAQQSLFYSHRRGQDSGRMASLIWIAGS